MHHGADNDDQRQGDDTLERHCADGRALQIKQEDCRREQPEVRQAELDLRGVQDPEPAGEKRNACDDQENRDDEQVCDAAAARKNGPQQDRKPDHDADDKAIDGEHGQRGGERSDARVIAVPPRNEFVHRDGAIVNEGAFQKL